MPKRKRKNDIDVAFIEKQRADNPENYFSPEETERRMLEVMRRLGNQSPQINLMTGQNLSPPFLSDKELKERGYPSESEIE